MVIINATMVNIITVIVITFVFIMAIIITVITIMDTYCKYYYKYIKRHPGATMLHSPFVLSLP